MSEMQAEPEIPTAPAPPGKGDRLVIGVLTLLGAFGGIAVVALVDMKAEALALVAGLVGLVVGNAGTVVNYTFGSSAGSSAKDGVISRLLTR